MGVVIGRAQNAVNPITILQEKMGELRKKGFFGTGSGFSGGGGIDGKHNRVRARRDKVARNLPLGRPARKR